MSTPRLRTRLGGLSARPLGRSALQQVREVMDADPIGTCMVSARFESAGMDREHLGGCFWGIDQGRRALLFSGTNVVVLRSDGRAAGPLAEALVRQGRQCASITGRAEYVLDLWDHASDVWGPARDVRADQPLMVCADPPRVQPDSRVRPVGIGRLAEYFPAAVSMFTEEVGVDPTADDGGAAYRSRIGSLLSTGRAFARIEGSTVVYKAEIGALSSTTALIQGVWVHPGWRGHGIAAAATASVVETVQRLGRIPSLYVNSYNTAARATYARVGFRRHGTFASVLF